MGKTSGQVTSISKELTTKNKQQRINNKLQWTNNKKQQQTTTKNNNIPFPFSALFSSFPFSPFSLSLSCFIFKMLFSLLFFQIFFFSFSFRFRKCSDFQTLLRRMHFLNFSSLQPARRFEDSHVRSTLAPSVSELCLASYLDLQVREEECFSSTKLMSRTGSRFSPGL